MSNWNQVEEGLRSWTPRTPSPSVRARLFAVSGSTFRVPSWSEEPGTRNPEPETRNATAPGAEQRVGQPAAWHWLAPAMAMFLLGMFVLGRPQAGFDSPLGASWAVSPIDQPQLAAYSPAPHHSEANSPPVTTIESTFGWTNEGSSLEAPAPMGQTNSPMR